MIEEISCDTRYDHHIDKRIELCARLNLQEIVQWESETSDWSFSDDNDLSEDSES